VSMQRGAVRTHQLGVRLPPDVLGRVKGWVSAHDRNVRWAGRREKGSSSR
jgi:hypothetical protein